MTQFFSDPDGIGTPSDALTFDIFNDPSNPDDDLVYALIIKNLSDRQILIDKKLVDYIAKRITRSYGKISDFIYKIDQISLKEKKSIDFKIIKKALEMN